MSEVKVDSFYYDVDSGDSFHFTVKRQSDGEHRIYIDEQPEYPSHRSEDPHSTHRYGLSSDEPYVCYEPRPRSLDDARTIAESWARHTVRYMRTGKW